MTIKENQVSFAEAFSGSEEPPVSSPCVSVCALDEEDICTGCYRSAEEIRLWGVMSNREKRETVQRAYSREKLVNPFI